MKAELVLLGKRVDMAPRMHRRILVVLIYSCFAVLMATFWQLDRWRTSGVYMIFATFLINRFFLGGYYFGGLIKPFNGKSPRRSDAPPPFAMLALRMWKPAPEENEYRNDERETAQRDRAHYLSYQVLTVALALVWLISDWMMKGTRLLAWVSIPADLLLYGFVLSACIAAITLPQAILLWTEPDMESDGIR
jgi:hypothetical protein